MLNYVRADLLERYDREARWEERVAAAEMWAAHVAAVKVRPVQDVSNVVVSMKARKQA
jgi:hypothetical protein